MICLYRYVYQNKVGVYDIIIREEQIMCVRENSLSVGDVVLVKDFRDIMCLDSRKKEHRTRDIPLPSAMFLSHMRDYCGKRGKVTEIRKCDKGTVSTKISLDHGSCWWPTEVLEIAN